MKPNLKLFKFKQVLVTTKLTLETEQGHQILTYSGIYLDRDKDFIYLGPSDTSDADTVISIADMHAMQLAPEGDLGELRKAEPKSLN